MDTNIKNNVNINGTAVLRDPQVIPIAVSATEDSVTIDIDAGLVLMGWFSRLLKE